MPRYPTVLMHGMGGFNKLQHIPFTMSYFNGVRADLQAHGEEQVFIPITDPWDSSEKRAAILAPKLQAIREQSGAEKLNLIGHSQGGLDARVLASPAGHNLGDIIASITTIASPHHGSPIADLLTGLAHNPLHFLTDRILESFVHLLEDGVYPDHARPNVVAQLTEMTTKHMREVFNPKYVDAPGVVYGSYAGRTNMATGDGLCDDAVYPNDPMALDRPQDLFKATSEYMTLLGLQTDGLVPIQSAKWGTFLQCIPGDHVKEVGMFFQKGPDPFSGFDHLVFYRTVVARLRAQGL